MHDHFAGLYGHRARVGGAVIQGAVAQQKPVSAIDIALEPDATMVQHVMDANARPRVLPEGALLWMRRDIGVHTIAHCYDRSDRSAMIFGHYVCAEAKMTDPHHALTAIDIALEPDAAMMSRAFADNAALRENFPQGFALDATHQAHITLLQCFVHTADLPSIYVATQEMLAKENYTDWKLTAFKYYYVPAGAIGLAGIVIEPTMGLIRLQQQIIDAVAPYTVNAGAAAAFYTTPEEPDIHPSLIPYVSDFVPAQTGKNYSPHVSTGVGTTAFLDALLAKPFEAFTFSPTSASVYQLGNYGTARKELKAFPAKP